MDENKTLDMKTLIADKLNAHYGIQPADATADEVFSVCAILIRELASKKRAVFEEHKDRQLHYLSMEFLMGRSLAKNAFNLGVLDDLSEALEELGFNASDVFESEPDAGLGNGGLGRLAACYMDSMTSLDLPATGYSLCYELGLFRQEIHNGRQIERSDRWTLSSDVWLVPDYNDSVEVRFGGHVEENWDYTGKCTTSIKDYTSVMAVPRDMLITGYNTDRVNVLRLWEARSPHLVDMAMFSGGNYVKSMEERTMAEVITKVLYPADDHVEGKILRVRQQYFFVSATAQNIVKIHRKKYGTVKNFADHHVFQINDTHPTWIIPELMRIFMDEDGLGWDEAFGIVSRCVAYTNHTILREALECWPQDIVEAQVPRIWQIIKELDRRCRSWLGETFGNDEATITRNLIIHEGKVHMANICLYVCFKVNGVSELHSNILKDTLFHDIYTRKPDMFTNVTNGVDHRRWLAQINPGLHNLICDVLGSDSYLTKPEELAGLEKAVSDPVVLHRLEQIKLENKKNFSNYVLKHNGVSVPPEAIFDVQVKRLHEYKRQLLCAMYITYLQQLIHDSPGMEFTPRCFFFGAKAASSYKVAKRIISLICSLADDVNNDPLCKDRLQVVFLENYRVSVAEKLMPAAQISEQISTAGKEASGTGNMKFMMNGAITIGTLDGANVEMYERLGDENMFLFGLHADEVTALKARGYDPLSYYNNDDSLRRVLNRFNMGFRDRENYSDLVSRLVYGGDEYMHLADYASYLQAHRNLYVFMADKDKRATASLRNIARSGIFASDRAVAQYAENIWHI